MSNQSTFIAAIQQQNIRWQSLAVASFHPPSKATQQWLLDEGSLTAHLVKKTQGDFAVNVLRQSFMQPTQSERVLLNIPPKQVALVREVILLCHQQPWVFARSVIPLNSLKGSLNHLRHLKAKPLGHLLFTSPSMTRLPFEIAKINIDALSVTNKRKRLQTTKDSSYVWGRRSKFYLEEKPLSVAEIFLPAFIPWETT